MNNTSRAKYSIHFNLFCAGLDLSITHNIDPREFVEIFVAFSVNHLNGAEPTLSSLDDFERKELANYKNKPNETSKLQNFNDFDEIGDDDDDTDDVMEAYICTTPNVRIFSFFFFCENYSNLGDQNHVI